MMPCRWIEATEVLLLFAGRWHDVEPSRKLLEVNECESLVGLIESRVSRKIRDFDGAMTMRVDAEKI